MASKYQPIGGDADDGKGLLSRHSAADLDDDDDLLRDGSNFIRRTPHQDGDDPLLDQSAPRPVQNQPYSSYPYPPSANLAYSPPSAYPPPSTYPPPSAYPQGPYMPPPGHSGFQTSNTTTTVIIQQPGQPQIQLPRDWSSSICECGRDCSICCYGFFCPCCLQSEVAQDMGESCCVPCCVPGWLITLRTKMRLQENISGSVMDDCCDVVCCGSCVLCQLAYEIKVVRENQLARATQMRPV